MYYYLDCQVLTPDALLFHCVAMKILRWYLASRIFENIFRKTVLKYFQNGIIIS